MASAEEHQSQPERKSRQHSIYLTVKSAIGAPIPILLLLYMASLLTSLSGAEIFGWLTALLTTVYILVDRLSPVRDFQFFRVGADIPLFFLVVVASLGLALNAPKADFWSSLGALKWILLLYGLTYALDVFNGLNRLFRTLVVLGTAVSCYAVVQHFTGVDLRQIWGLRAESAVLPSTFDESGVFQVVGFFSSPLTYGFIFSQILCFPFAAVLTSQRKPTLWRLALAMSSLILGLSLAWTYSSGVWMSTVVALTVMTFYVSRKHALVLIVSTLIAIGGYSLISPEFNDNLSNIVSETYKTNANQRNLWRANISMFSDHPWIGVGVRQNETLNQVYFRKLGIENAIDGNAHNTYFNFLSTTGILGLMSYMLFMICYLLMTHRLWTEVPRTHFWHRVFVLGALGAQISLHTGGLTHCNFSDAEVNHATVFIFAVIGYMSERYARGIVPDDHAL